MTGPMSFEARARAAGTGRVSRHFDGVICHWQLWNGLLEE